MTTLIIVLTLFALWHFVYESILLPSIRQHLRNDLFVIRDELRQHRQNNPGINMKAFNNLSDGINSYLTRLPLISIGLLARVSKKLKDEPELVEQLKEKERFFIEHSDEKMREIRARANKVLDNTMLANMGAWFAYAVPIVLVVMCFKFMHTLSKQIFMMSPHRVAEFLPSAWTDKNLVS